MSNLRYREAGAVRAVIEGERRMLEVLAVPYGSASRADRLSQWFTSETDVMLSQGERRPLLYMHGYSPQKRKMSRPGAIGVAEASRWDEAGVWMIAELNDTDLANRVWDAAQKGNARASTGSIDYLVRPQPDEKTGRYPPGPVEVWPVAELSIFDGGENRVPVSDDAVVLPLRAIFKELDLDLPEAFEAGEAEGAEDDQAKQPVRSLGGNMPNEIPTPEPAPVPEPVPGPMLDEAAIRADERAKLEAVMTPARRAIFNTQKETVVGAPEAFRLTPKEIERGVTIEDKKQVHEFVYNLRMARSPSAQTRAFRVLEEHEAAEGLPMVPQVWLDEIVSLRNIGSTSSKIGIRRIKTDKLIFNVPREVTAMTALAAIAEEGAYVANEPAFGLLALTLVKYGSMVTVTEELLADQNLFQTWFAEATARAWALAENTALFTLVKASGTQALHSATLTDAEVMTWFFALTDPWRDGCSIVMNLSTMAFLRAILITTPRAYGDFPLFGGGKYPSLMEVPIVTDTNWEAVAGGDLFLELSMINPQAMVHVENGTLGVLVDPYGDSANGRVRYFPRTRFVFGMPVAVGVQNKSDHA